MSKKPCTHIMWPEGTEISEKFFRACSPVQARDNYMLVHGSVEDIRSMAEKYGQKGLVMSPDQAR